MDMHTLCESNVAAPKPPQHPDLELSLRSVGPSTFERVVMRVLIPHDITQPGFRVFEGRGPPTITITDYIMRIAFYVPQSCPTMWVQALLYIDRLLKRNHGFMLASNNVHRIIITSVMAALKFNEDKTYANEFFARVAGVALAELNALELAFLRFIDWDLYINPATFTHAVNTLSRPMLQMQMQMHQQHQQQQQQAYPASSALSSPEATDSMVVVAQ
eukprot:m51a1_g4786 putative n-terminal domain protein (217) ;mRNA; f:62382-63603